MVSRHIIDVCIDLANNADDVVYFNSVSNVCDLLLLLLSGKKSFNHKNTLQRDEGKLQRSASSNDLFNGYELAYGAFLTLAYHESSSTQIIESMCNDPAKYDRAWKLLLLHSPRKIDTLDNIVSRYLTKFYFCFLGNELFRKTFIQNVNIINLLQYIELPSMASFVEELCLTPSKNNDNIFRKDDVAYLFSTLFIMGDDNLPFNASQLLTNIIQNSSYEMNACEIIKQEIYENERLATQFIGKTLEQIREYVCNANDEQNVFGLYGLHALTAIVRSYDGGCVVVQEEGDLSNEEKLGNRDDNEDFKQQFTDCQIAELPFFNILFIQIGQFKDIVEQAIDKDERGLHCPFYCVEVIKLFSSLVRLECKYADHVMLRHGILKLFVTVYFKYLNNTTLLVHLTETFSFLLLNKNPATSELLSYRRKSDDILRRAFLDDTSYIRSAIKTLDEFLTKLEQAKRQRSASFEQKFGDTGDQATPSHQDYHIENVPSFIIEARGSLVYMLNVIQHGVEKVKNIKWNNWIKRNIKTLNMVVYLEDKGPFEKSENKMEESLKRQASDEFTNDEIKLDCDCFEVDDDQNIVNYSPTNSPLSSPTNKRQLEDSYFESNLAKYGYGFSNDGDDNEAVVAVDKTHVVSKEVATTMHSKRMSRAKRRSYLDDDDGDDDDDREHIVSSSKKKIGSVTFNLPSLSFSSDDEEDDDGALSVFKK